MKGGGGGFPVVPTVNLHALPSFAVLCQTMNFVRKERGESGLISFAAYSWNRILRPPGLGLVQSVFRNKVTQWTGASCKPYFCIIFCCLHELFVKCMKINETLMYGTCKSCRE